MHLEQIFTPLKNIDFLLTTTCVHVFHITRKLFVFIVQNSTEMFMEWQLRQSKLSTHFLHGLDSESAYK